MTEQREIERKFLVTGDGWRDECDDSKMIITSVYVANTPEIAMRVGTRVLYPSKSTKDEIHRRACITINLPRDGLVRSETEIELDWIIGSYLVDTLRNQLPSVEKVRHFIKIDGLLTWEIDCFMSEGLQDLIIAEIELPYPDYPDFEKPDWIGEEVTNDSLYCNAILATRREVSERQPIDEEVVQNFIDNWTFLLKSDGTVDLNLLKLELSDFSFLIKEIPKVYDHIAGLSKHMYFAETIIAEADRRYWEMHRDMILDDIADMTSVDEVREYLDA